MEEPFEEAAVFVSAVEEDEEDEEEKDVKDDDEFVEVKKYEGFAAAVADAVVDTSAVADDYDNAGNPGSSAASRHFFAGPARFLAAATLLGLLLGGARLLSRPKGSPEYGHYPSSGIGVPSPPRSVPKIIRETLVAPPAVGIPSMVMKGRRKENFKASMSRSRSPGAEGNSSGRSGANTASSSPNSVAIAVTERNLRELKRGDMIALFYRASELNRLTRRLLKKWNDLAHAVACCESCHWQVGASNTGNRTASSVLVKTGVTAKSLRRRVLLRR